MKLKLVEKREEAKGTKSFFWEPEKPLTYIAGQYYYFTLPSLNYPDPRGATRHFTLSSSPTEGNLLRITTRMRQESGFKKTLDELPIGTQIEGEGPNGTFILDDGDSGSHVFLAGGIGITPFRSMIKYAADKNLNIPIHLIYANSIPEEITFAGELQNWAKSWPNLKLDMTITKPEESSQPWSGLTGRIDENLIQKLVSDFNKNIFWVCGPPAMVEAMEQALGKLGLSAGKLHSEKFTGY
ncbi:FAD-dependent oxidoreductase [Candidatus Woesebacteria bacterium]|nr:FAD-dependent oxidoreductase [Candidatus Woesebacteria bacterium]